MKVLDVEKFRKLVIQTSARDKRFREEITGILTDHHDTLYIQGDGRLHHNPLQQLFMILVQVKSISEVMQAYLHCDQGGGPACNTSYITSYFWKGSYDFKHRDGTAIVAP